jgi:hypothetical protein
MRTCMRSKAGTIRRTMSPNTTATAGIEKTSTHERPMSSRVASTIPITIVSGAVIIIVVVSTTSICTCCTSLVMRVIRVGAPNWPTSRVE